MIVNYTKKAYNDHKHHIPDALWNFLYMGGRQIFIFGVFIISLYLLSPYEFGLYNYLMAVFLILVLFGDFGLSAATSKHIAELRALNHENERIVLFNATIIALISVGLIGLIALWVLPDLFGEKTEYILVLFPSLIFLPLAYLYNGIYRGMGRFKSAAAISLVVSIASLIVAYFVIREYGLYGALWANNLFSFLLLSAFAIGYREWVFKIDFKLVRDIGKYSVVLGATSLSYYLYSRVDIILLGHFGYITEIGFYELVNKAFLVLIAPFTIAAQVISPVIAARYVKNNHDVIFHNLKQFLFLSFIVSTALMLFVVIFAPSVLSFLFPTYATDAFIAAFRIMLIPLIGQAMATTTAIAFSLATGHARINMVVLVVFGIINVPLTYILIKNFGFMGAVYGTVIIRIVTDLSFITLYYRTVKKHATATA